MSTEDGFQGGANPGIGNTPGANPTLIGAGILAPPGVAGDLGWRNILPAEYQQHPSLSHYPDLGAFVKSSLEQEKLIGRDKIVRPTENDSKETWGKYFDSIGRPQTPDEYGFKAPEDWPKDFPIDPEGVKEFQNYFHEIGMPKDMADKAFNKFLEYNKKGYEGTLGQVTQQQEQAVQGLQQQWGNNYQQNLDVAKRAVQQFDTEGKFGQYLEQSGLGNDPQVINFMHKIGSALLEDSSINGSAAGMGFNLSDNQARAELDSLYNNPSNTAILMDVTHPQHRELKMKAEKLAQLGYPTKK